MLPFDRRAFIASLGGVAAVRLMSHEARADALEGALMARLETVPPNPPMTAGSMPFPTAAQVEAQITTRSYRRGTGGIFYNAAPGGTVSRLPKLPAAPTLADFFALRFDHTRNHCLQSANKALQRGADEEIVLACLLHDTSQELLRAEHGYWGAQMYEPYVPARTAFAIRNHQPLRFFADTKAGYEYPDLYKQMYGVDYVPEPHVQAAYAATLKHRWYHTAREVTVCDLYAFDPKMVVTIEPFVDIIGRHFKQPKAGLGHDGSPVAHMWRTLANPDSPL